MRTLASNITSDEIIRILWMQRMPTTIRCTLSASEDIEVTKLATIADRMLEATTLSHPQTYAVEAIRSTTTTGSASTNIDARMSALEKTVAELASLFKENSLQTRPPRSPTRSNTQNKEVDICFFHRRFGPSAKKCEAPCAFAKPAASPALSEN